MLSSFASLFSAKNKDPVLEAKRKKDAANALEKKKKKEIIQRQTKLQDEEINQTWRIIIGNEIPKKKKETFLIEEVTRRNVWMEENFIFNKIKLLFPDKVFHPIHYYVLKWQPPKSYFQVIIPINNPSLVENAILMMSKFKKSEQKKTIFFFTTIDPTQELFAPNIHPASLVSYRTKTEVLKKLSDLYLENKITVDEVQQIFTCDFDVWKAALYNYLPEDEQVFHKYLIEKSEQEIIEQSLSQSYLNGDITLQEYEDKKYPDRKRKKDIDAMDYPLPFEGLDCIICGEEKAGVISCHTCNNMVCVACIKRVFQGEDPDSKSVKNNSKSQKENIYKQSSQRQSYLMLHHKYCMQLGEFPPVNQVPVEDLAYLREFRATSRLAALKRFVKEHRFDFPEDKPLPEVDEDELERLRLEELKLKELEEEEARRLMKENPPELQELRKQFDDRKKKYERINKELEELTNKIQDTSHTDQFIARNVRLKKESLIKLRKNIFIPVEGIREELEKLSIPGSVYPELIQDIQELFTSVNVWLSEQDSEDA